MTLTSANPFEAARGDFPILAQEVNGHPLIYFDNAATTQKPRAVLNALMHYYERDNANVHRGIHTLSSRATEAFEGARAKVARYIGAASPEEIVFTRGTTEAINLVAQAWGGSIDSTPDAVPVISAVPQMEGLFLAAGFSGHGFGIGPGAGRLAADLVCGDTPVVDPTPYRYARFTAGEKLAPAGAL